MKATLQLHENDVRLIQAGLEAPREGIKRNPSPDTDAELLSRIAWIEHMVKRVELVRRSGGFKGPTLYEPKS